MSSSGRPSPVQAAAEDKLGKLAEPLLLDPKDALRDQFHLANGNVKYPPNS